MPHRLEPLLKPRSIAVLGASERAGTVGRTSVENLLLGGFAGPLYAVNPRYESVCGVRCYASLAALPETVEQVIFAVSDQRIESALEEALAHGARAATLMSALVLENDRDPPLRERIRRRIETSGLVVCGANGMGYYNFNAGIWACGFRTRAHARAGNVAYISHSGSGMCGIVDCEERIDFNLVVSTGQELAVSMDEYLDYALDEPSTRVVGLFMETARNPEGLRRAFEKAEQRRIPIVALKVGRTQFAARLTVSHSGAMAGKDGVYQALFERYGVQRVQDMDQLATALIMFAQPHALGQGGLVSIHDSGGERQLLIDLADAAQVPLTELGATSAGKLAALLDPGLPPINPLDGWSAGGADYDVTMQHCFSALMSDAGAALGAVVHDRAAGGGIYAPYVDYLRAGHAASGKPAFLVANRQGTGADPRVVATTREGFPVLDGVSAFLRGAKCLLDYRDHHARRHRESPGSLLAATTPVTPVTPAVLASWRKRLLPGTSFDEEESMQLLRDFKLPASETRIALSAAQVSAAAAELGFPVVLKTAERGIHHKSDKDGVRLDLRDEDALASAYDDIAQRIGPRVVLAPMLELRSVEMLLGMFHDSQFGPVVVLGAGGVHVEALADFTYALPPFTAAAAARLLRGLRITALLHSPRHRQPLAIDSFCRTAAQFSVLVAELGESLSEIDLNPVMVGASGCTIVDALVVARPAQNSPAAAPAMRA